MISVEDAIVSRWHPKTVASARLISFDLSLRLELRAERFANRYDVFPRSRSTVLGYTGRDQVPRGPVSHTDFPLLAFAVPSFVRGFAFSRCYSAGQ